MEESIIQINSRLDNLDSRMNNLESRMDKLESRMDALDARLTKVEKRLDDMNNRLIRVEVKLDSMERDIRGLRWWMLASVIAIMAVMIAFAQWQASWFQHSLDKSEAANNALLERSEAANKALIEQMRAENRALLLEMDRRYTERFASIQKDIDRLEAVRLPAN